MLWLALHFPNLPLETIARQHFDQHEHPLVVLENNRVCRVNPIAAEHGIILGTTLATAHSICPTLLHQQRDLAAESQRLKELVGSLYRFSSHICVQEPDCILLEIGGSLRLLGNHEVMRQAASELCQELGHESSARVAQTPWAAVALARSAQTTLAKVPLTTAGLELAGVANKAIERFDNMGIYTLGPLLDLPSKQIGKRFGKPLLIYLEQLTGARPDPRPAMHPTPYFRRQLHLLEPMIEKEGLHSGPMAQLAEELQQWLITHQLGCTEVQWLFSNKQACVMSLRFADARQNAQDILSISLLRLEDAELPEEVISIGLKAKRTQPWQNQSQTLFQLHTQANPRHKQESAQDGVQDEAVLSLVDELSARLGDHACTGISCVSQHTPELAWQTSINVNTRAELKQDIEHKRPVWLFNPPRQVRRDELTLMQGPERIQSSWWIKTTSRDYYIARHQQGAECWAFVDDTDNWYLHGYFS